MIDHNNLPCPWDALAAIHDEYAKATSSILAQRGGIAPQLFVLEVDPTGEVLHGAATPPDIMYNGFRDEQGKEAFALMLKELLDPTSRLVRLVENDHQFKPNLLVQINEVWMVRRTAEEMADGDGKLPSECEDRQEAICVFLHTRAGTIPTMHPVQRKPNPHLRLDKFGGGFTEVTGRMSMGDAFAKQGPSAH